MQAQGIAFAIGVPPHIYAFHCYTRNSIPLCRTLAMQSQMQFQVEPGDFTSVLHHHLRTLYAQ